MTATRRWRARSSHPEATRASAVVMRNISGNNAGRSYTGKIVYNRGTLNELNGHWRRGICRGGLCQMISRPVIY